MNPTTILWLGLLLALLPALEQSMRTSTWPAWLSVPALYRGCIIAVVGAASGALGSVLQDGLTWQQGLAAGLGVAIPAILKLIFHAEAKPVEVKP
jgi:hypothetical protein